MMSMVCHETILKQMISQFFVSIKKICVQLALKLKKQCFQLHSVNFLTAHELLSTESESERNLENSIPG